MFYKKAISKYGVSAEGVHWISQESQYKRFDVLTSYIINVLKSSSIVDAGCGFAEYYNYLKKRKIEPKSYTGYDIEEFMIEKSSSIYPHLNFQKKNILKNKLEEADYYICSGAMNILTKKEMFLFIDNCFNASNKGFIFNFLQEDSFNKVSVSEVVSHCKNLCSKIHINNNYLQNDITIYLNKDYLTN